MALLSPQQYHVIRKFPEQSKINGELNLNKKSCQGFENLTG